MDDLDQLIDSALDEPTASQEDPQDEPTPSGEEATEPVAEGEERDESQDPEEEPTDEDPELSPDEDDASDEPDGTEEPGAVTDDQGQEPPTEADPEKAQLRQEADMAKRLLANLVAAQQQAKEREAAQKAEEERKAKIEALKQQWAEMDPEEAAKSQAAFIAAEAEQQVQTLQAQLSQLAAEREAEIKARQEAEAKEKVIPLILDKFGLKPEDRRFIERLNDPYAMEEVAKDLKELRRQQTANARKAKKQKAQENPALLTAAPQSGPAPQAPRKSIDEYADVDEYLDALFG